MIKKLNNKPGSSILLWLAIIFLISMVYSSFVDGAGSGQKIAFTDFLTRVDNDSVQEVTIRGDNITGVSKDGTNFYLLSPGIYPQLLEKLQSKGVKVDIAPTESAMKSLFSTLLLWLPGLLFIGVWIYFMKNMQGGGAMSFGKSKAKLISDNKKITFADVAGIQEARDELAELVDFLRNPAKFQKLGATVPHGCLLIGEPGTGKTLLAKAIAGEAGVPFFTISGSDFVEMFVGVGASRVRDMFQQAKKQAPCILFIDEIDGVGRHRGGGRGNANDEREQTLNQILVEMDGFSDNEGVIVIAATNRPDVLDKALLRPGRFDRQITVLVPDIKGREEILKVYGNKVPLAPDVDLRVIARGTPGFTGADLKNLVNEAALIAAKHDASVITMKNLEEAKDKVMMGTERKSMIMTEAEKRLTAYHEGGHALACLYTAPHSDPIHKVTIIPRGSALGLVMRLPETDKRSVSLANLRANITIALAGRIAEEIIFGKEAVTSGASSDISAATDLARRMVMYWGFGDSIGTIKVPSENAHGYEFVSENLSKKVDEEVAKIIDEGNKAARDIITKHLEQLHRLAKTLLEYETLSGNEVKSLILDGKSMEEIIAEQKNHVADDDTVIQGAVSSDSKLGNEKKAPKNTSKNNKASKKNAENSKNNYDSDTDSNFDSGEAK